MGVVPDFLVYYIFILRLNTPTILLLLLLPAIQSATSRRNHIRCVTGNHCSRPCQHSFLSIIMRSGLPLHLSLSLGLRPINQLSSQNIVKASLFCMCLEDLENILFSNNNATCCLTFIQCTRQFAECWKTWQIFAISFLVE